MLTDTRNSPNALLRGLPFDAVEWTGGLYGERFATCASATVPHLQKMFESKEISHVLENFRIAAGEAEGGFDGTVFGDGDFYKWMEAAVYTGVRTKDQALLSRLEEYVDLIGRAQRSDGYLSTKQIIEERSGGSARLKDINEFEVYNLGHLFTSACLYARLTGSDSFLRIARKAAEYLKRLYEEAEEKGEAQTAVCPSHYMGLAELYRTTGEKEYLELLEKAIALRDKVKEGMDDNQDRLPLREHRKIIGHAVRANYLYAGVADLCLEEKDPELQKVLDAVWQDLTAHKLYITGGCGALYNGASPYGNFFDHQLVHQAYGYDYQLPNITAYNETCASVGGVYWAWRMFCLEKRPEYADVLERMVLNVNLAAVSLDGKRFFYENMLRRARHLTYDLVWGQERAEYILSYCCPPNLARLIAQLSEYAYAVDETGIYTVLYGASRAELVLKNGEKVCLVQETEYPYDGKVRFTFHRVYERLSPASFLLHLRIPGWVRKGTLVVKSRGGAVLWEKRLEREDAYSYQDVLIFDPDQLEVLLDLQMETRLTCAHPMVEEAVNQVAVERGPLVYCVEGIDADTDTLDHLLIPSDVRLCPEPFVIEGRTITSLTGVFYRRRKGGNSLTQTEERRLGISGGKVSPEKELPLYQDYGNYGYDQIKVRMIPYFAWDNRGPGEMRVWIPVTDLPSVDRSL